MWHVIARRTVASLSPKVRTAAFFTEETSADRRAAGNGFGGYNQWACNGYHFNLCPNYPVCSCINQQRILQCLCAVCSFVFAMYADQVCSRQGAVQIHVYLTLPYLHSGRERYCHFTGVFQTVATEWPHATLWTYLKRRVKNCSKNLVK